MQYFGVRARLLNFRISAKTWRFWHKAPYLDHSRADFCTFKGVPDSIEVAEHDGAEKFARRCAQGLGFALGSCAVFGAGEAVGS